MTKNRSPKSAQRREKNENFFPVIKEFYCTMNVLIIVV